MKTFYSAIALAVALPSVAHAQAAPAPAPASMEECCCKDMTKPMKCCEKHGKAAGHDDHAGHDMGQHQQQQKPNQ